ncbi:MAG: CD225/dispanin family protein [Flavobacteriales bacterium]|jgi:hypothetical protein|uniref:CD225/dispanin family protein n=1 Tax=Candidatus Ulvibacter alkanivorans TaxID=2267620 RepID=UPI000DF3622E|nr:CD225/dispanin family protein [Candidatus Ulvibacter alkanivorans]MCH2490013.1 CD225/dispanin family protein [Flavobacteriales bacterium]
MSYICEMNPNQSPPPDNHLVWAILSTVLCCLPLGIVAIIKSSKVDQLWYQGHYDAARKAAADAKKWSIYSALSIALILVVYFAFIVLMLFFQGVSNF